MRSDRLGRAGPVRDRDRAGRVLVAVVLGGMTEGHEGWRSWPIDPDRVAVGARRDAEQARTLAHYLKLDNAGWLHLLWKATSSAGNGTSDGCSWR
jgi:hypothetical protein